MTTRKTETNGRLLNFIRKHKFNGLVQVYTKPQLVKLCQAYGVSEITRLNKPALAKRLSTVVLTNRGIMQLSVLKQIQNLDRCALGYLL